MFGSVFNLTTTAMMILTGEPKCLKACQCNVKYILNLNTTDWSSSYKYSVLWRTDGTSFHSHQPDPDLWSRGGAIHGLSSQNHHGLDSHWESLHLCLPLTDFQVRNRTSELDEFKLSLLNMFLRWISKYSDLLKIDKIIKIRMSL